MKAILKFDATEEKEELELAVQARDLFCALWDIRQRLHTRQEYEESPELTLSAFHEIVSDYDLDKFFK